MLGFHSVVLFGTFMIPETCSLSVIEERHKGPPCLNRLAHTMVDDITIIYRWAGCPVLIMACHTRSIALIRGLLLQEVCVAATWELTMHLFQVL